MLAASQAAGQIVLLEVMKKFPFLNISRFISIYLYIYVCIYIFYFRLLYKSILEEEKLKVFVF